MFFTEVGSKFYAIDHIPRISIILSFVLLSPLRRSSSDIKTIKASEPDIIDIRLGGFLSSCSFAYSGISLSKYVGSCEHISPVFLRSFPAYKFLPLLVKPSLIVNYILRLAMRFTRILGLTQTPLESFYKQDQLDGTPYYVATAVLLLS